MTSQNRNSDINHALAASLKRLAARKPIEKITIKEITDGCDVIRPTFYNHFQDKYDLIEWIINTELLEPIRPMIRNDMIQDGIEILLISISKEKEFFNQAIKMEGPVTFDAIALKCSQQFLEEILKEIGAESSSNHRWLSKDVVSYYFAQSMSFVMIEWLRTGMKYSPKEMSEAYQYIITHSLIDVAKEMGGKPFGF